MRIFSKYTDEEVTRCIEKCRNQPRNLGFLFDLWMRWVFRKAEKGELECYRELERSVLVMLKEKEYYVRLMKQKIAAEEKELEVRSNWHKCAAERGGREYKLDLESVNLAKRIERSKSHILDLEGELDVASKKFEEIKGCAGVEDQNE